MNWIERYQYQMRRTRLLGIIGASCVVIAAALEALALVHNVSIAEVSLGDPDFRLMVIKQFSFLGAIAAVFIARLVMLSTQVRWRYSALFVSSVLAFAISVSYVWWVSPVQQPSEPCTGEGLCFGVYDIRRADRAEVAAVLYVWISVLRTGATALYAALKYQHK